LEQALGALATAASLPVSCDGPSLWRELETRIAARSSRRSSRWMRAIRGVAERGSASWASPDVKRPFRLAWLRDSLTDALDVRGSSASRLRRRPNLIHAFGLAGAAAGLLIALLVVHRVQSQARSTILANSAPMPGRAVTAAQPETEAVPAPSSEISDS